MTPSENQTLRACSSFWEIFGSMKPFYLQVNCPYKLFKVSLLGVLKCALFAFFHSKSAIFRVTNCKNFVILPTFQSQNDFKINGDQKYVEISSLKQKLKTWILNFRGVVPTVLPFHTF